MQHVTVILYGPTGNRLALSLARWLAIVDLAVQCRWKAAGTIAPPVQFDEEDGRVLRPKCWTGDYRTPAGQTVTRADASRMATALGSSVQAQADSALVEFLTFCEQGGFTISSGAAQSCATHDLDALAHAATRPPCSPVVAGVAVKKTAWSPDVDPAVPAKVNFSVCPKVYFSGRTNKPCWIRRPQP